MVNYNIGDSFNKLVRDFGILYRGCWIEERDGGYIYNRQFYASSEELDDAITKNLELLNDSINRIKQ